MLGQARQQYSEGKYQEALDNYRRSLTALPKSPNMEKRRRFIAGQIPGNVVAEEEQGKRGNGHTAADAESRRFEFHVNAADAQQDQDGGSPRKPQADALDVYKRQGLRLLTAEPG